MGGRRGRYKHGAGDLHEVLLFRDDESCLELAGLAPLRSFTADPKQFLLAMEAERIASPISSIRTSRSTHRRSTGCPIQSPPCTARCATATPAMQPKVNSENYPRVAYGLDLAGYSQGKKSALVRAEWPGEGHVKAEVMTGHPFAKKRNGIAKLDPQKEQDEIERMLREGRLCVDVPIDLQGLMGLDSPERSGHWYPQLIWQLTFRPVDYAFHALPPLADRIGAPVVRFRNILTKSQRSQLGSRLWETYPAATLSGLGHLEACRKSDGSLTYKDGRANRENGIWVPSRPGTKKEARDNAVACIAERVGIMAGDRTTITDDVLDAVLCALTGVAPRCSALNGSGLDREIKRHLDERLDTKDNNGAAHGRAAAPKGYVLLSRQFWGQIDLARAEWKTAENQE